MDWEEGLGEELQTLCDGVRRGRSYKLYLYILKVNIILLYVTIEVAVTRDLPQRTI